MRKRSFIVAVVLSVALVFALCWTIQAHRTQAAHARLIRTENVGGMRRVCIEFEQTSQNVYFTGEDLLWLRVSGHWLEAKQLLLPDERPLFSGRASQQIALLVGRRRLRRFECDLLGEHDEIVVFASGA